MPTNGTARQLAARATGKLFLPRKTSTRGILSGLLVSHSAALLSTWPIHSCSSALGEVRNFRTFFPPSAIDATRITSGSATTPYPSGTCCLSNNRNGSLSKFCLKLRAEITFLAESRLSGERANALAQSRYVLPCSFLRRSTLHARVSSLISN